MRTFWPVGLLLGLVLLLSAAANAGQIGAENGGTGRCKVVEEFMSLMVERQMVNSAHKVRLAEIDRKMLALLAPYYFESIGIDQAIVTINKYSPDGFRLLAENGDYVSVRLLRKTNAWPTLIVFKTAEYQGRFVIEPSGINLAGKNDPSLVTPWFYAAEQHDLTTDNLTLPEIGRAVRSPIIPASAERTRQEGRALVARLIAYLESRKSLREEERRAVFEREVLPVLARGYTDIYGVDAGYYEDLAIDPIRNPKIGEIFDCYVVLDCAGCLYERYYFKIVMEGGEARIMPTAVDNVRKTISPLWLRE